MQKIVSPQSFLRGFGLSASIALIGISPALAGSPISLFDGKSLYGWRVSAENPEGFWVEDGAIVASGERAHLFYEGEAGKRFDNFELSLKVKTEAGSNSGVYFHTTYQAEDWPKYGLEAQVNGTHYDYRKTGSLYAIADYRVYKDDLERPKLGLDTNAYVTAAKPPHKDNEWFDYVIRVEDGTVTTRVNGILLVQWEQTAAWTDPDRRLRTGTFALQAHDPDSIVHYKDIMLTILEPDTE